MDWAHIAITGELAIIIILAIIAVRGWNAVDALADENATLRDQLPKRDAKGHFIKRPAN